MDEGEDLPVREVGYNTGQTLTRDSESGVETRAEVKD